MERPTLDQIFMEECELWAKRSSCKKIKTAAIIVKDERTISTGYNGVCKGKVHCNQYWSDKSEQEFIERHHEWSTENELHAEQNAIIFAAKYGISVNNATLYTLYSPCINCAKVIVMAGIKEIVYKNVYDRKPSGLEFCLNNGITCRNIESQQPHSNR